MQDTIATLSALRRYLNIPLTNTADDDRLLAALQAATAYLERETARSLSPQITAHNHEPLSSNPAEVYLCDDLLELQGIADADGAIPLNDVESYPATGVITRLRRINGTFNWGGGGVTITGVWGWHDDPTTLWALTGDSVEDAPLSASATTMTVTDADAPMSDGLTPRFSVGALLLVDNEFMRVVGVDGTANTLTVERGVNGSTATEHPQYTAILQYRPPYDVLISVLTLAAWLYRAPDGPATDLPLGVVCATAALRRIAVA
jgi:hypothetical protein